MRSIPRLFALVPCLFALFTLAGEGYGPLRGGDRNPLVGLFYIPRPESAWLTPKGVTGVELNLGYSNLFEVAANEAWLEDLDMEQLALTLHLRRGLSRHLEGGLTVPLYGRWSGFLDKGIQSYHDALGLPNDRRDEFADHRYAFLFGPIDGTPLWDDSRQGFEIGEPELFLRYSLARWSDGAAALRGTVKPGIDDAGSGETDSALELSISQRLGKAWGHLHLAAIRLGEPDGWDPVLVETSVFASAGTEIPWRRYALQVQLDFFEGPIDDTGLKTLDPIGLDLLIGLAGKAGLWRWQLGFAEDLTGEGPAVDFTLDLHLSRRF